MIDTVVMYLHGIQKYYAIEQILNVKKTQGLTSYMRVMDLAEHQEKTTEAKMDWIVYGDGGKTYVKGMRGHIYVKSSSYFLAFNVNYQKDHIMFNFSIPKYLYGHNIRQFVTDYNDPEFSMIFGKDWGYHMGCAFSRFKQFVRLFFEREFPGVVIDLSDLEIQRIDFCFNQVFRSKNDAITYLNAQRRLNKKYMRGTSDNYGNYSTGLSYKTQDQYFKIYHKGTEYEKNDKREHEQINNREIKRGNGVVFDTTGLQGIADKILRYEFGFTHKAISAVWRLNKAKKNIILYQEYLNGLKETNNGSDLQNLKRDALVRFKEMRKNLQKTKHFRYEWQPLTQFDFLNKAAQFQDETQLLDAETFKLGMIKFKEFFDQFQVEGYLRQDEVKRRILDYNTKIDRKRLLWHEELKIMTKKDKVKWIGEKRLAPNVILGFLTLLEHHKSMDEIKRLGILPQRTINRYVKTMRKLGFTKNLVMDYTPVYVSKDFGEYYAVLDSNTASLTNPLEIGFVQRLRV